jgi:hypothetical protein
MADDKRDNLTNIKPAKRSPFLALGTALLSAFVLGVIAGETVVWHCDVPLLADEAIGPPEPPMPLWCALSIAGGLVVLVGLQLSLILDRSWLAGRAVVRSEQAVAAPETREAPERLVPTCSEADTRRVRIAGEVNRSPRPLGRLPSA